MSARVSRKRKAAWKIRVAQMQEAKARKRQAQSGEQLDSSTLSTSVDDSSQNVLHIREAVEEVEAVPDEEESTRNDTVDYKKWVSNLERENQQMLAMMMYDNYRERFGLQKTSAADEVGLCLGICGKTIRIWRKQFLNNSGQFLPDKTGKYPRYKPQVANDKINYDIVLVA